MDSLSRCAERVEYAALQPLKPMVKMKNKKIYVAAAALCCMLSFSCKEETIGVYAPNSDGVYFSYPTKEALNATVNFADSILTQPQEIAVTLKLKLMGYAADHPRKVVLKSRAVQGIAEAKVLFPEIVFQPNEFDKEIRVKAQRPTLVDSTFQAQVYIDSEDAESQIGPGIKDFQTFTLHVKETYRKPERWDQMALGYLGPWSAAKQILMVRLSGRNDFYTSPDYYQFVRWNLAAIDSLRRQQKAAPSTPITIDIPFTNDNTYAQPWYWTSLQTTYLGTYQSSAFVGLCNDLDITTANEYAQLGGDEASMKAMNLRAVHQMMLKYNTYYQDGWRAGNSYKGSFYIPMLPHTAYELVQPQAWKDEQGGKTMIEKYYGPYSEQKYKFMIDVWLEHKGADFVLNQLFPVMNEWGNVHWDDTLGGEDAIKACNQLFRQKAALGSYDFSFPTVP